VTEARVDYGANCGNMSSAVGPFAVEEGLVPASDGNIQAFDGIAPIKAVQACTCR